MRKFIVLFAAGFIMAAAALPALAASSAPTVVTGSATAVTLETASLAGSVTPNGAATTFSFQYGTSTSYGSQTATRNAGRGTSSESVSANLFGLTAGTLYHYRLIATNSAGETDGADQTFTTTALPVPAVVTGSATAVTTRSATLGGSVTPNGATTTYSFQYGASTSYGSQSATRYLRGGSASQDVSANLFGLTSGTVYHYRLVATSSAGETDGADGTFTTASAPVATVVTGPATAVTARSATLTGTLTANGSDTTYDFQYGTSTSYGSQTATRHVRGGAASVTAFGNVFGLTAGTLYHYRLVATNASGESDGADQTFTTSAATVLPHAQWFAGSVTAVGTDSLTVGVLWTGPHDGSLNGQTVTVSVASSTRIDQGPHHTPIALGQIQVGDLVALRATGDSATSLTATRIHVYCNCHWVGGTISAISSTGSSISVQVARTGPYDTVLNGQDVTIQVNADTVYLRGPHHDRIGFSDLQVGDGVGIVFSADGFFKAPGFDPTTATFTAKRVHVWGHKQVPSSSSDASSAAQTVVPG
jgi:Domain of unknown function (DUF5666)